MSQTRSHGLGTKRTIKIKKTRKKGLTQRQILLLLQGQELEFQLEQRLSRTHGLEFDDEPEDPDDDPADEADELDPDLYGDESEWELETGERLESGDFEEIGLLNPLEMLAEGFEQRFRDDPDSLTKARNALEELVRTGHLPPDADPAIEADWRAIQRLALRESGEAPTATFEVKVTTGGVSARVLPTHADAIVSRGTGQGLSKNGKKLFDDRRHRREIHDQIASVLLAGIQAPFFAAPSLESALLELAPVDPKDLGERLAKYDKSSHSRLGDHGVACQHGVLPLSVFWPSEAELRRVWVVEAARGGLAQKRAAVSWIVSSLEEKILAAVESGHPQADVRKRSLERLARSFSDMDSFKNAKNSLPSDLVAQLFGTASPAD